MTASLEPTLDAAHAGRMDAIYRWQRHIYDFTRKYFLFGRDRLIAGLDLAQGGSVLELGCGTGRNLALIGKCWPHASLFGIDISAVMLETAQGRLGPAAHLAQGDACHLDAVAVLGRATFDRVIISYALSMIPQWEEALRQGADLLAPGGSLHIVDFGEGEGLARPARAVLRGWLARFDVTPRIDLVARAEALASARGLRMLCETGHFGYYRLLVLRREIIGG